MKDGVCRVISSSSHFPILLTTRIQMSTKVELDPSVDLINAAKDASITNAWDRPWHFKGLYACEFPYSFICPCHKSTNKDWILLPREWKHEESTVVVYILACKRCPKV